ncbi:ankyrin repeat-containing domain protein [Aspergillus filifer]
MSDTEPCTPDSPNFPPELPNGNSLFTIVRTNDIPQLRQYISSFPPNAILDRYYPYFEDPFYLAACHAKPETLRILLDVYTAAAESSESFKQQRRFSLLHVARSHANIDIMRFILDSYGRPGKDKQSSRVLGAVNLHEVDYGHGNGFDRGKWVQDRITRADKSSTSLTKQQQPRGSVLGFAVSRTSRELVQRLVDYGADVYLEHVHLHYPFEAPEQFGGGKDSDNGDIPTPFILKPCGQSVIHMLRPPRTLSGDAIHINVKLLELLIAAGAEINHPDDNGNTPLHIMVPNLRLVGTIKILLDDGADVFLTNNKGVTAFRNAARGFLDSMTRSNGVYDRAAFEDSVAVQDEMMGVLREAAGEHAEAMMGRRNLEGKTPVILMEETRQGWSKLE